MITDDRPIPAIADPKLPPGRTTLTITPEMRAVAERCRQPRMVGMASRVTEESEVKRKGEAHAASK